MRYNKPKKFKYLSANGSLNADADRRLPGVASVLLNILAARDQGKDLGNHKNQFVQKVLSAFDECFETNFGLVEAQHKVIAIDWLANAYEETQPTKRQRKIDEVIEFIETSALGRKLLPHHKFALHAPAPRRGYGSRKPKELALSRIPAMFEYSRAEYYRDKKSGLKRFGLGLEFEILNHWGIEFNLIALIGLVGKLLFAMDRKTLGGLFELLNENGYQSKRLPVNSGLQAMRFFERTR